MTNFLINSDKKLINIVNDLKKSQYLGIDTEFIRESTYFPVLALLQISDSKSSYCIDILEITQNRLLVDLFVDKKIVKIMHSSRQDLEVIFNYFKCYPQNIFDTQIASNLITDNLNISYANIVKNFFDVELKQGSWRTDWLKRPLSNDKLEYACNDVKYLVQLYKILNDRLDILDRLNWFNEEQKSDLEKENVIIDPKNSWKKINIPPTLAKEQLSKLMFFSEWREKKAISEDMPKRWIFSDSELLKVISASPNTINKVLDSLKHQMRKGDKNKIKTYMNNFKIENQKVKKNNFDASLYNKRLNRCYKALEKVSIKYNINQTLIANKRDIDYFSRHNSNVKFLNGWRFKIFGKLVQ